MGVKASNLRRIIINGVDGAKMKWLRGIQHHHQETPKGYVPIAVGVNEETKLFMVHTTAFYNADFMELLRRSAEEYGFRNQGVLRIPYEAKAFEERMIRAGAIANQKLLKIGPIYTTNRLQKVN